MGEDGHVASLFPKHPALEIYGSRYVEVENAPKLPPDRISVSLDLAKEIPDPFVFFIGEAKQTTYERFLRGDESPWAFPVMALVREDAVIVTDRKKRETEILRFS